jgi:hypothetical protein
MIDQPGNKLVPVFIPPRAIENGIKKIMEAAGKNGSR